MARQGTASGPTATLCTALEESARHGVAEEPAAVARAVMLDGIACQFAGHAEIPAVIVRNYAAAIGGRAESSVVGVTGQLDAANAAYANGTAMHALDFEAVGTPPCHGTSSILPALVALAERESLSGSALICAFVLGWEAESRLRTVAKLRAGFHPTAVYGPIAAAAASAVLLRLDAAAIAGAIATAASSAGGLAGNGQTAVKAVHAGNAARCGVQAALLARNGLIGGASILERQGGFGDGFLAEARDWDRLTEGWGESYFLSAEKLNYKPYPVQFPMINVVDAALDLVTAESEHGLFDVDGVASLEIIAPPQVTGRSNSNPRNGHAGKFSPEYCAAVALVFGEVGIDAFTDARVAEPRIRQLIDRTTLSARTGTCAREVSIKLVRIDGRVTCVSRQHPRGSAQAPMSRQERIAKVGRCLSYAGAADIADDLVALVERFATPEDVVSLGQLLRTPALVRQTA